jgi:hypothetical protein
MGEAPEATRPLLCTRMALDPSGGFCFTVSLTARIRAQNNVHLTAPDSKVKVVHLDGEFRIESKE